MNKKQLVNQLNNQKGLTGADVLIGVLIILTTLGVITMIYTNLVLGSRATDRKTGATRIATNLLENMETLYYDDIAKTLKNLADQGEADITNDGLTYVITGKKVINDLNTTIPNGYKAEISLQDVPEQEYNLLKKITVKVMYQLDGQEQNVALSKVFEREVIRECNSPNFEKDFIKQMIGDTEEYVMYSENAENVAGNKIICPVHYNPELRKYELIDTASNQIWYSYSNKEWARVLVLDSAEYANSIDTMTNTVSNPEILKSENSYVWIPRFGVENGGELFGNTFFKYKNTDMAIVNSYDTDEKLVYHYFENIEWSIREISFNHDKQIGKWSKYADLATVNTDAYQLNHSQYGPMTEH